MKDILIVVDIQNDFINGSLGTKEAEAISPKVYEKIKSYLEAGKKVCLTLDTHHENYMNTQEGEKLPVVHCIEDTDGWLPPIEYSDLLRNHEGQYFFLKKECFGFLPWINLLSNNVPSTAEIVGLCTDICVISNALILRSTFPELRLTVDPTCCAGSTPEAHEAALTVLRSCQVEVAADD